MNEAEAIEIATAYATTAFGMRLDLIGAKGGRKKRRGSLQDRPGWVVSFKRPHSDSEVVDPAVVVVIVDEDTKLARFYPSL